MVESPSYINIDFLQGSAMRTAQADSKQTKPQISERDQFICEPRDNARQSPGSDNKANQRHGQHIENSV